MKRATLAAITTGLGAVLAAAQTRGDDAPKMAGGGKILIVAFETIPVAPAEAGFRGLSLVDPENGNRETVGRPDYEGGVLSPDGRLLTAVAAHPKDAKKAGVWVEDLSGEAAGRRVFDRPGVPSWSGDGKRLVIGTKNGRTYETYRVNLDGSGLVKLPVPDHEFVVDWARDGSWLASWNPTIRAPDGPRHIRLIRPDGTGAHEVVSEPGLPIFRISPDGREVVYAIMRTDRDETTSRLWIVNTDGSDRRQVPITFEAGWMVRPRWSPDGKRLALGLTWNGRARKEESTRIVVIGLDGRELRTLPLPPLWRVALEDWK